MKNVLDRIYVVLVSPDDSSNIGAVCRAMKTMGITRLRIVSPGDYDENKIRYVSVHAYDIYLAREEFQTLAEALSDISLAAAATRRKGKKRKYAGFSPEETASKILSRKTGKSALVFGNEEHGLTDRELAECTIRLNIPSSPSFPSLNLSHAVQIATYAVYRSLSETETKESEAVSAEKELDLRLDISQYNNLASEITECLARIGFFKLTDDSDMRIFLRDIFSRSDLNIRERDKIIRLFRKISGLSAPSGD